MQDHTDWIHEIVPIILIGGESRRMGEDKSMIKWHGIPHYEHLFNLLSKHFEHVYIVGRREQLDNIKIKKKQLLADKHEGMGPLGGIFTVMERLNADLLVVPCDMPFLDDEHIMALLRPGPPEFIRCFVDGKGKTQPLIGIWRHVVHDPLASYLSQGHRAVMPFVNALPLERIWPESDKAILNINTQDDFLALDD